MHPIDKLASLLDREGIEYVKRTLFDGFQIILPWCGSDVICHSASYGGKNGLLEIQGPALFKQEEPYKDDVLGCLTIEDVFERIKAANATEHLDKESQEAVLRNFVEDPKKSFDEFETERFMNEEYYKEYLGEFIDKEIKPFDINSIENRHKSALEIMDIRARERLYKDSLKKAKEKGSDND